MKHVIVAIPKAKDRIPDLEAELRVLGNDGYHIAAVNNDFVFLSKIEITTNTEEDDEPYV